MSLIQKEKILINLIKIVHNKLAGKKHKTVRLGNNKLNIRPINKAPKIKGKSQATKGFTSKEIGATSLKFIISTGSTANWQDKVKLKAENKKIKHLLKNFLLCRTFLKNKKLSG